MKNYYLYEDLGRKDKLKLINYFFQEVKANANVILPKTHQDDVPRLAKYLARPTGIHKILLTGTAGSGKSAIVKLIAAQAQKRLVKVDVTALISFDSFSFVDDNLTPVVNDHESNLKIALNGSLTKSIKLLFKLMQEPEFANSIVFFDDMDYLLVEDSKNKHALLALINGINDLPETVAFIGTETSYKVEENEVYPLPYSLRHAFQDSLVVRGEFTEESLFDYSLKCVNELASKEIYAQAKVDQDLLYKVLQLKHNSEIPSKLKIVLQKAFALSDLQANPYDYLGKLYELLYGKKLAPHVEERDDFEFRTYDELYLSNNPQAQLSREEIQKILGHN
ncbi:AAA family ATPase [Psittacicella gerlachiana]|uniref:AAA+ ATPase domain-containing protein n=1 Tax=Psittacicella gerlachiana TaxID=2028574 RepID=A0A3A1YQR0_9GAMM|nr:AAA family ATPase [Psittacicella gerlachiana]RIY38714.1 hypothetical protein CKF59_00355 [Psittacicella gerlachiana]